MKIKRGWSVPSNYTGIFIYLDTNLMAYFKDGVCHREDGPAVFNKDGSQKPLSYGRWRLNGKVYKSFKNFLEDTPQKKKALFNSENY